MLSEKQLEEMYAENQIRKKLHIYIRGIDRWDKGALLKVFHKDSEVHNGPWFEGTGMAFIENAMDDLNNYTMSYHQISTSLITVEGDTAGSETYVFACFRSVDNGKMIQQNCRGRYCDEWIFEDGEWWIKNRRFLQDIDDFVDIRKDGPVFGGARDKSDPTYAVLKY